MMKNSPKGRIGEYSSSLNIRNGFRRRGGIRPNFSTGKFSKKLIGLNFSTENLKPLHHEPQLVSLNSPRTINSLNSSSNLITFHFLSNWGSPDFLSVRHISIIGSKYQPIPITSISSISEPKLESNLKTLFHKPGIKTTEEFTWEIPWSPTSQFTIICYIPKKSEAQIIRIWNPITHCESGVCDVEIKFNSTEIFCGQVPKAFVIDIPIPHHITTDKNNAYSQAKDILLEAFPSLKPHPRFSDKWGTYPIRPAESISFEVVSTFEGGNMFGINAIDIFDEHGKIIKWNDIKEVIIENCTNYKDPKLLFMKNKDLE
ncbi:uncharacterized protein GO595_001830 [Histomonas meleagridis]|uniref:uncharacterized protein n=1 Tax=Histomonas meleagridis TaxID=135588 RepID=UPI00355956FA|nr:hypothetical protein GO595_001830 [Histomonas meleagridis]